jgi:hypothetical protein
MKLSRYRSLSLSSTKLLLCSIAVTGLLTVCGPSTADPTDPTKIVIKDFNFAPTPLTVKVGLFKSGGMDTNESFSFKFDKPGTYHYTCSIHPRMVGTIIVQ